MKRFRTVQRINNKETAARAIVGIALIAVAIVVFRGVL